MSETGGNNLTCPTTVNSSEIFPCEAGHLLFVYKNGKNDMICLILFEKGTLNAFIKTITPTLPHNDDVRAMITKRLNTADLKKTKNYCLD